LCQMSLAFPFRPSTQQQFRLFWSRENKSISSSF
jgi:hypothetical protein